MLGSHNSFSYLTPTKWWMKLLSPWSKCQNKTIVEQYNAGVRYFDVRVAFNKDGSMRLVHNWVEYPSSELFEALKTLNNKPDVYLRILLDMRKKPKGAENTADVLKWFYNFIDHVLKNTTITIDKAIVFWNWKHIIDNGIDVTEYHASVSAKWYEYIGGLECWAELHNNIALTSKSDVVQSNKDVLLIDYV